MRAMDADRVRNLANVPRTLTDFSHSMLFPSFRPLLERELREGVGGGYLIPRARATERLLEAPYRFRALPRGARRRGLRRLWRATTVHCKPSSMRVKVRTST